MSSRRPDASAARAAAGTVGRAIDRAVANLILRLEDPETDATAPLRFMDGMEPVAVELHGPGASAFDTFSQAVQHRRSRQVWVGANTLRIAAGSGHTDRVLTIGVPLRELNRAIERLSDPRAHLVLAQRSGVPLGATPAPHPKAPHYVSGIPGTGLAVLAIGQPNARVAPTRAPLDDSAALVMVPTAPPPAGPTVAPATPAPTPSPTQAPTPVPTLAPARTPGAEPVKLLRHRPRTTPDRVLAIALAAGGLGTLAVMLLIGWLRRRWQRQLDAALRGRVEPSTLASYERADLSRLAASIAGTVPLLREAFATAERANDRAYVVSSDQPRQFEEAAKIAADVAEQATGLRERLDQATLRLDELKAPPSGRDLSIRLTDLALELALGLSQSDPKEAALLVAARLRELAGELARQDERSAETALLATLPYLRELATALDARCEKLAQGLAASEAPDTAPFRQARDALERANAGLNVLSDRIRQLESRLPPAEEGQP